MESVTGLNRHRFGANYVPSKNWMAMWNAFDPGSIRAEFEKLAEIGCDHVRVLLLWPAFHPLPNWVSPAHLQRLAELMQIAKDCSLDVNLAPLSGWISGYAYIPPFIKPATFYNDLKQQAATDIFLTEVLNRSRQRIQCRLSD
jgi:endo-1,4-beta-mannosidase